MLYVSLGIVLCTSARSAIWWNVRECAGNREFYWQTPIIVAGGDCADVTQFHGVLSSLSLAYWSCWVLLHFTPHLPLLHCIYTNIFSARIKITLHREHHKKREAFSHPWCNYLEQKVRKLHVDLYFLTYNTSQGSYLFFKKAISFLLKCCVW